MAEAGMPIPHRSQRELFENEALAIENLIRKAIRENNALTIDQALEKTSWPKPNVRPLPSSTPRR